MCGRYNFSNYFSDEKTMAMMNVMEQRYPGEYKTGDIFPGDSAPAIISNKNRLVPVPAVFGMPGFQGSKLLINARTETVAEKKTFSESLREHRVILPATGFYEWGKDAAKTKYLFTIDVMPVLYLCGLYKVIDNRCRFVILTCPANESMSETHDRMPVIVNEKEVRPYLTDLSAAMELIATVSPKLTRQNA